MGARPANPLIPVLEMSGRRTEKQEGYPAALGIDSGVVHLLAHRLEGAQIVMLLEQSLKASTLLGFSDRHDTDLVQQSLLGIVERTGRRFFLIHTAEGRKSGGRCPAK